MESTALIILLPLATFALVIMFAMRSKKKTEKERENGDHTKSTLAADAPDKR